jgi:hypothetical protein
MSHMLALFPIEIAYSFRLLTKNVRGFITAGHIPLCQLTHLASNEADVRCRLSYLPLGANQGMFLEPLAICLVGDKGGDW